MEAHDAARPKLVHAPWHGNCTGSRPKLSQQIDWWKPARDSTENGNFERPRAPRTFAT
jgi:hypothetical protein